MTAPKLSEEIIKESIDLFVKYGNVTEAAEAGKMPRTTLDARLKIAMAAGYNIPGFRGQKLESNGELVMPQFVAQEDMSAEEILNHMGRRFQKDWKRQQELNWFKVAVTQSGPLALVWFGDPHLGNNGCNVPLLRRDVELVAKTPHTFGANLGDTVDNWGGTLTRLYAENDVSRQTERTLARWFLQESGIRWAVWLEGNHCTMSEAFSVYLRSINCSEVPMMNWRAKFSLEFPNGKSVRIDAAHDHKGHSIWNDLHGQERAAFMDEPADLYIAGHRHSWGVKYKELGDGRVVTLARARGYKWIDDFAIRHGYAQQQCGASVVTVVNPDSKSPSGLITAFADVEEGLGYLGWLRGQ